MTYQVSRSLRLFRTGRDIDWSVGFINTDEPPGTDAMDEVTIDAVEDTRTRWEIELDETSRRIAAKKVKRPGWMWLYVFDAGDRVKVGIASDPRERMRRISYQCGVQLKCVFCMSGTFADEARMLRQFSESRLIGEWFSKTGEVAKFLVDMAKARTVWL